jgi:hypothetical protein
MQGIINMLKLIPDVIWSAIIASGITFLGVTLSNRANRKSLLLQLNHAAQEKDKERELQIRKDVYLEAAEVTAEAINDVMLIPSRIANSKNVEIGNRMLQALSKVHMVATLDTAKSITQFVVTFNQLTLPIISEMVKYLALKQELTNLNNLSEMKLNTMKETKIIYEHSDSNIKQDPKVLDAYERMFDKTKAERDNIIASITSKEAERYALYIALASMCINTGQMLQKEFLNVLLSIRKELKLDIDSAEYINIMKAAFNRIEGIFTQDTFNKIIQG